MRHLRDVEIGFRPSTYPFRRRLFCSSIKFRNDISKPCWAQNTSQALFSSTRQILRISREILRNQKKARQYLFVVRSMNPWNEQLSIQEKYIDILDDKPFAVSSSESVLGRDVF